MILGNARVDVLKVQVEGATDGESRMLLKTISRARRRTAGSHAGSHTDEQPWDDLDPSGQPGETSPRSRTVLNGSGCLYRNLRI